MTGSSAGPADDETERPFAAVVLAGGGAVRMDGIDKSSAALGGRTLLELVLDALVDAREVVVVGTPVRTTRKVTFTREDPAGGGPAAGLLAGRSALLGDFDTLVVVAVDMPRLTAATVRRLRAAAAGHDGAFLTDASGRRQLAGVLDPGRLDEVAPGLEDRHGLPFHRLLAGLDLAGVAAIGDEGRDVDTWADLRDLQGGSGLPPGPPIGNSGVMNLHDWIDELCDVLDIDTEVDEGLVLDLARVAARNVERRAAPITAYLLGYAAGLGEAHESAIEQLAEKAIELAEHWDRPGDVEEDDEEIPDDSTVDHTGDTFED